MKSALVAIVLAALAINPTLHVCCLARSSAGPSAAMPACHERAAAAAADRIAPELCNHERPPAVAPQAPAPVDPSSVVAATYIDAAGRLRAAALRAAPAIYASPPNVAGTIPLRI